MRVKKTAALILAAVLLCLSASALAETWYVKTPNGKTVNLREEGTQKVIGHIPYGTALIPYADKCTEISAYVTYNGVSGYVKWNYLVREKPAPYQPKNSGKAKEEISAEPYGEGEHSVSVTGGFLQFQNKKGKGTGTKYSEVKFDEPVTLTVTASVPKGQKIDYWVVNGVRLTLSAKSIGVTGEEDDVIIEIIYK